MKKILVVGGTRFIGKGVVKRHLAEGDEVNIVTRGVTYNPFGNSVKHIRLDLMNPIEVKQLFPKDNYDIIYDNMVLCPNHIKERLNNVRCEKYVMVSTAGVYKDYHYNIREEEYDAKAESWTYCGYEGVPYDDRKRQSEAALVQEFGKIKSARIRIPVIIGEEDYTRRLEWYIEHVLNEIPMNINNLDIKMPFSFVDDVSNLIYTCGVTDFVGAINGALYGEISLREVLKYIENSTGKKAILDINGEKGPYKSTISYGLNVDKAENLGVKFGRIEIIYRLLDYYIERRNKN